MLFLWFHVPHCQVLPLSSAIGVRSDIPIDTRRCVVVTGIPQFLGHLTFLTMPPPVSMKLAQSFAGAPVSSPSTPTSRPGSVAAARAKLFAQGLGPAKSEISIYKGVSDRPLGWKRRKSDGKLRLARESELCVQRWDGRNRMASPWDGLRRVSVYLHECNLDGC